MARSLLLAVGLVWWFCPPAPAFAGDGTAVMEAWSQMGFAIAAAKACPKVKISPEGMKELSASLDAEDQANVFTNTTMLDYNTEQAGKALELAGDRVCDIALDHMRKSKFKLLEPAD